MRTVKKSRASGSPRLRVVVAEAEVVVAGHEARNPVRPELRQVLRRAVLPQRVRLRRRRQQARRTQPEPVAQRRRERRSVRQAGVRLCSSPASGTTSTFSLQQQTSVRRSEAWARSTRRTQPAYGPVALFVGGTGEVRYKDFAWKDLNSIAEPKESVSPRFDVQRVSSLYYGWGATTADINHDGTLDIVSGPFYYLGPGFTDRKMYREGRVFNASTEFAPDMVNLAYDFTADGWPDILSSLGNRHMDLYVNPQGQSRRWDKFSVLTTITTEIVLLKDLDKDGKPEVIFGGGGVYAWAKPDPANPTAVWTPHPISSPGEAVNGHGIGVGDVNGDGRMDIAVPTGWYEQPVEGIAKSPWVFHAVEFGNNGVFGNGGGEMGVYDVNGDGLADVVNGSAHNWGIKWFEQKKAADGTRTFEQHSIAQDFSTNNAGGVVFSESHAARFVDMDGDKIPDFVTGKRLWSELENYNGNDPYGAAVLYIYRTVRNTKAPGGAEFVPELVHNKSGVGSSFDVVDLNKDGRPDIVTATAYGTFVFFAKPAGRAPSAAALK